MVRDPATAAILVALVVITGWFVLVALVSSIVVFGGMARVSSRAKSLARDEPGAVVFLGWVYPSRFGPLSPQNRFTRGTSMPCAFVADDHGFRAYGAWHRRPVRDVPWIAIAQVKSEVLHRGRRPVPGMTVVANRETRSFDIRPGGRDVVAGGAPLTALISRLELLRVAGRPHLPN
jgi:hypothetical protein